MEGVGLEEEELQHLREERRNINEGITRVQSEEQMLRSERLKLQRDIQAAEDKNNTGTENLRREEMALLQAQAAHRSEVLLQSEEIQTQRQQLMEMREHLQRQQTEGAILPKSEEEIREVTERVNSERDELRKLQVEMKKLQEEQAKEREKEKNRKETRARAREQQQGMLQNQRDAFNAEKQTEFATYTTHLLS